ncbi:MAG TPA: hypothetical protein VFI54_09830 [Solirubrobacteraceae bacterium]|nr:hypothetical protein [Solirubrobacteraceae bacterium]
MNLRRAAIFLSAGVASLGTGTAYASWGGAGAGSGAVKAAQLPTATAPGVSASVHSVTVTWPAATIGGQNVAGYTVKRYDSGGTAQTVGAGCSGTISGLTCTEAAVPSGTWRYTVTPVQGAWTGSESPQSSSVTVQSPGLSFTSSTTVTSLPATLNANLTNLVPGQAVTFRLDDQNTGTVLSSTLNPTTVPASGAVTATVTIPAGVADGSHNIYAIDGQGDVASASITVAHPTVAAATIAKSAGGTAGYVKQGGTYYVYANVSGSGTPPPGVSSLTADVSTVTTGQTATSLSSGGYTVDGQSYNYRSAQLTAKAALAAGSKSFTVSLTDSGGAKSTTTYSVTVDNTAPKGSGIQTANAGGGTAGRAEVGDTITLTYSEPVDPDSLFADWDGSSMNVAVVLVDGGSSANDTIQVWDVPRVTQIQFGTIDLGRKDYITSHSSDVFGASGTPSTMVMSGSTITITLGSPSVTAETAAGNGTMTWTPSASATDRAGNAASTGTVTESGSGDKEF